MKVLKVVLTGGPCGGKTTAINKVQQEFIEKGYHVIVVPEAATILINSGIRPFGINGLAMYDFQKYVIDLQLQLETHAEMAADELSSPTIIICDRGILDDKAYVSEEEYTRLLHERNLTHFDIHSRYDLVLHLKTAAEGKEEFYTTENNGARTETIEEAKIKDKRTLEAWYGHENLKIIGNDTDFSNKIARVLHEIYQTLKTPYPIQKQEKYLVEALDYKELLEQKPVIIEIEQYVEKIENGEIIYRYSNHNGEVKYTKITKKDTPKNEERIVLRRNVTEEEYNTNAPNDKRIIKKTRYCFAYLNQYFKLDCFDDGLKVLEIEYTNKTTQRKIPNYISIIDNVTNNIEYRNALLYEQKNTKQNQKSKIN